MTAAISTIVSTGASAAAAPAGTVIATLSHTTQVTQKGVYRCVAYVSMGSGPAATDTNNIVVTIGSTNLTVPIQAVAGASAAVAFNATLDGVADVVLKVGAAAATAAYSGTLTAEFAGAMGGLHR